MRNHGGKALAYVPGRVHLETVQASLREVKAALTPRDGPAALLRAALIGHSVAVQTLIDSGVDVNAKDKYDRTALLEAAFAGHLQTVRVLLENGADVDAQDRDGWSALMEAAAKGHRNVVTELLASGASTGAKSKDGWTALKAARGHDRITELLTRAGAIA